MLRSARVPRGKAMGTAVRCVLVLWAACPAAAFSCGVLPARPHAAVRPAALVVMADKNDETKGAVAGVVLGGLLAGPFGALWGAQIGGAMGANNRAKREQGDQLAAMGLDEEVLKLAKQTAMELEEAETALAIVKGAENSQRSLIETLDRTMQEAYTAAEGALRSGDEAAARTRLEERQAAKAKRTLAESDLAAASQRVASMQASVAALAERASQIEQKISRTVVATRANPSGGEPPPPEDPLEKRFREL